MARTALDASSTPHVRRRWYARPGTWVLLWAVWSLAALGVIEWQANGPAVCSTR